MLPFYAPVPLWQAPAWVLCAAYCILRPFHIVLLSCCLSLALSAEFNCVLSVWVACREGRREAEVWCGGKLLTPSTNGNELVLHCATWPAANLIQLVGIGMRLNGIYLFNCRAPRGTKPFLLNHFIQIESQLALQLESHHSMCHEVEVSGSVSACGWHCLAFSQNRKVKSIFTCCTALHCTALRLNKSGAD